MLFREAEEGQKRGLFGNMSPRTANILQGIGLGLSQLEAGRMPNLSPVYARMQEQDRQKQMQEAIGPALERMDPGMRQLLAAMPPSIAAPFIMKTMMPQEPKQRRIIKGADGFNYFEDGTRVLPNVAAPPKASEGWEQLTPEDVAALGLDASKVWQRGLSGANAGKITQVGGNGVNVSVSTGSGEQDRYLYGSDAGLPSGWRLDRQTGQASQIPGGPAAVEAQNLEDKETNKDSSVKLKLGTTLNSIALNLDEIEDGDWLPVTGAVGDFRRTGVGQLLTGSDAVDFGNRTKQITDSAALAEIQNMRDNSPTGGAVGQLTDGERVAIGNAVTALNSSTSAEEYTRAAKAYRQLALDIAYGEGNWKMLEDGTVHATTGVAQSSASGPKVGTIEDGYRFLGGDPQNPESWEQVN